MWKTEEIRLRWAGGEKRRRQESVSSVGADQGYLENNEEAEGGAEGARGLNKSCKERVCPFCRG